MLASTDEDFSILGKIAFPQTIDFAGAFLFFYGDKPQGFTDLWPSITEDLRNMNQVATLRGFLVSCLRED